MKRRLIGLKRGHVVHAIIPQVIINDDHIVYISSAVQALGTYVQSNQSEPQERFD
jgi:hypothetical protein